MKTIELASIAKSLKISTKSARRKLRSSDKTPTATSSTRWVFTPAAAKVVRSILAA